MKHRVAENFSLEENETEIVLETPRISLAFSKITGDWTGLRDRSSGCMWIDAKQASPSLTLRVGGKTKRLPGVLRNSRLPCLEGAYTIGSTRRFLKHELDTSKTTTTLSIFTEQKDWTITEIFTLESKSSHIQREVEIGYQGAEPVSLREVSFVVPEIQLEQPEEWTIEAPGYPGRPRYPVAAMPLGEWGGTAPSLDLDAGTAQQDADAPASKPGLVAVHNSGQNRSLVCWAFAKHLPSILAVNRTEKGIQITQHVIGSRWMEPGSTARIGKQMLFSEIGPWSDSLKRFQKEWSAVGISIPDDRPQWAHHIAIYEVHVGKAVFPEGRAYQPYPRIEDLIVDLERIHSLGFNALLLMPQQPFPGYAVHDFLDAATTYGGDQTFKQLVNRSHELGIRILLDFVMHGSIDKRIVRELWPPLGNSFRENLDLWRQKSFPRSPYLDEHPEWFMRDEDGEIAGIYTAAFDHANPEWHNYIIQILTHYVKEYDVDGFRIDAPTWNFMPNWDRALSRPAAHSIYGAARLFEKARRELRKVKSDLVLYTEPPGPLFRQHFDLNYNYDEQWLFPALVPQTSSRGFAGEKTFDRSGISAQQLALWFEERRNVLPRASVTVHHLDSHDTFWWGRLAQFRHEAFGRKAANALFALCAFLDGGVMNYVGGEKGAEDFYRRLLRIKRELPEIRLGTCDYLGAQSNHPKVFALLWKHEASCAIPVIHFGDSKTECALRLRAPGDGPTYQSWSALNNENVTAEIPVRDGCLEITLPLEAYGVDLLVLRPKPSRGTV